MPRSQTVTPVAVKELDAFKEKCKVDAEAIVLNDFPKKIIELQELIMSDKFNVRRLAEVGSFDIGIPVPETPMELSTKRQKMNDSSDNIKGTPVIAYSCGMVSSNELLSELVDIVKPQSRQLIDFLNLVKMWITFMIPRIEDGNNFGVGVQEETLALVTQSEQDAATYLDQISRYYLNRARIISKIAKYPHVADYRRTIQELDEKEFVSLRLILCELRNQYSSLHDIILKNLEKIKKPRTAHSDHLF